MSHIAIPFTPQNNLASYYLHLLKIKQKTGGVTYYAQKVGSS
jgi:hypothetical protein